MQSPQSVVAADLPGILRSVYYTIQDGSPERMYEDPKKALLEAAYEALGQEEETPRRTTPVWWSTDIEELVIAKKAAYNKWLTTRGVEDMKGYTNVRRKVN